MTFSSNAVAAPAEPPTKTPLQGFQLAYLTPAHGDRAVIITVICSENINVWLPESEKIVRENRLLKSVLDIRGIPTLYVHSKYVRMMTTATLIEHTTMNQRYIKAPEIRPYITDYKDSDTPLTADDFIASYDCTVQFFKALCSHEMTKAGQLRPAASSSTPSSSSARAPSTAPRAPARAPASESCCIL